MRTIGLAIAGIFFSGSLAAQSLLQPIYDTQKAFEQVVVEQGAKPAFLEFLADDAIIFRPEAVNGREYLRTNGDLISGTLQRSTSFADVSKNGLLGYTMGRWSYMPPKGKPGAEQRVGLYATVWSRMKDGSYKAILDIETSHKAEDKARRQVYVPQIVERDDNKSGISAADATMSFLKMSMGKKGLGEAYDKFAAEDVRILREGLPLIEGRKRAENVMEKYAAVDFPTKVSQFETADMAYSWNACSYADSSEGMEKGNCLHIWKLRDKKWEIVLGVFARVANETLPVLKEKSMNRPR